MSKYAAHGDEAIGQVLPVTGVLRKKAVYNYPVVTGPPCGVNVFAAAKVHSHMSLEVEKVTRIHIGRVYRLHRKALRHA